MKQCKVWFLVFAILFISCKVKNNRSNELKEKDSFPSAQDNRITKNDSNNNSGKTKPDFTSGSKIDTLYFSKKFDLDNDGENDFITIFKTNDSVYMKIDNEAPLDLYASDLRGIFDERGEKNWAVLFDRYTNHNLKIAIMVDDPFFEGQALLHVYRYKGKKIDELKYFYSDTSFYDCLVAKNNFVLINTNKNDIYCCTRADADNAKIKVDKYVLKEDGSDFILKSSSFLTDKVFKHPTSVIF